MARGGLGGELWGYLRARRKWWLIPIILVVAIAGTALVLAEASAVAPLIYTIF